jgi:hypothetical protein
VPQPVSIEEGKNSSHTDEMVITLLPRLWNGSCEHGVIVGAGGMGKTVSLVRLWKTYLDRIHCGGLGTDKIINPVIFFFLVFLSFL